MKESEEREITIVPIDQVRVLNPRARDQHRHKQIVANIAQVGLKKPITVSPAKRRKEGAPQYDLVCGQGRLEAYQALGEALIPAIVMDVPKEERLLMSLVENMARRLPTSIEMVKDIVAMKERGDTTVEIARKTGLSDKYVSGLVNLYRQGELRLLNAVEKGRVPITVAIMIAGAEGAGVQHALTDAYENGQLKGKAMLVARKLVEQREHFGKGLGRRGPRARRTNSDSLVRTYQREVTRQKLFVKKARICETRLTFVTTALQRLFQDENFVTLLQAEELAKVPKNLAAQLSQED